MALKIARRHELTISACALKPFDLGPGDRDDRVAGRDRRGAEPNTAAGALAEKRLVRIGQRAGHECGAGFGSRRNIGDDVTRRLQLPAGGKCRFLIFNEFDAAFVGPEQMSIFDEPHAQLPAPG